MGNLFGACPEHLYIHWPFCKNKCHYCDFVAFEKHNQYQDGYHHALVQEITRFAEMLPATDKRVVRTLYIGGGTPSLWPLALFTEAMQALHTNLDMHELQEATIEVNPGGITREHAITWQAQGISRLSIGVQILDDAVLFRLNRRQRTSDVHELLSFVPDYFKHLSVDLILGLPGVTELMWWQTLEYLTSQSIDHISIYFLMIHENTPLYHRVRRGSLAIPQDEIIVALYEKTVAYLAGQGFRQYEISNFAREGGESLHNKAYWERKPYKGFGLGAASFTGTVRTTNVKNFLRYLAAHTGEPDEQSSPFTEVETLTEQQVLLEALMLGLRTRTGVGLQRVVYSLKDEQRAAFLAQVALLTQEGLLEELEGVIRLTSRGMIVENEVIMRLI